MGVQERSEILRRIETQRDSKALLYVTSDRQGMSAQIGKDVYDFFVKHLDRVWPSPRISFILHTAGGDTAAAWQIINLLRIFCEELEVIVPSRAHSAGTLMALGASRIFLTKQATLGPIDPSISGPLSPAVPGQPNQRVPVSVEAVQGYIDLARGQLGIEDQAALAQILADLSKQVHPLVLGQIFRTRTQIRELARALLAHHNGDSDEAKPKVEKIIDFLCSESGSHDRTINRREARELGLQVEKPSQELYEELSALHEDFAESMQLRHPFNAMVSLGSNATVDFEAERVIVESVEGGSWRYMTKGQVRRVNLAQPGGPAGTQLAMTAAETVIVTEGWEHENGQLPGSPA